MDLVNKLFNGSFMPHGHCLQWLPDLLFLHVTGDVLTVFAYFVIPLALIYLVKKRTDLAFNWIFIMFAAFIFSLRGHPLNFSSQYLAGLLLH